MQSAPHGSVKIEVTADDVETMRGITLDSSSEEVFSTF